MPGLNTQLILPLLGAVPATTGYQPYHLSAEMAMANVNPKKMSQTEETPKAPQRSSSVGRVLGRLFSKSPSANEPRSASENSPNANPAPLMDSVANLPQAPTRLAGPRRRTPPKQLVATIRVDDQQPEASVFT